MQITLLRSFSALTRRSGRNHIIMLRLAHILSLATLGASLVDSRWRLSLDIGRIPSDSPAKAGPPLAMFSPGGGRPVRPSWFDPAWASSGESLALQCELDFLDDVCAWPMSHVLQTEHGALRQSKARVLRTRSRGPAQLDARTRGVAWGMVEISKIEALLVWCVDLPSGACKGDVSLPEGTRLCCSTQVWKGGEVRRFAATLQDMRERSRREGGAQLQESIRKLERQLPRATTLEVPGPWPGEVTVSTQGQVAVQRLVQGRFPNPFEKVAEFGVVGTFELAPEALPAAAAEHGEPDLLRLRPAV